MLSYLEDAATIAGGAIAVSGKCCDNCERDPAQATESLGFEAAVLLECIFRHLGEHPLTLTVLVMVVTGKKSKEAKAVSSSFFHSALLGLGKHHSSNWWIEFMLGHLLDANMLMPAPSKPDVFLISAIGEAFRAKSPLLIGQSREEFKGRFDCIANAGMSTSKKNVTKIKPSAAAATIFGICVLERDRLAAAADESPFDFLPEFFIEEAIRVTLANPVDPATDVTRLRILESNIFQGLSDPRRVYILILHVTCIC